MGYTHYYSFVPASPEFRSAFPQLLADTRQILDDLTAKGVPTAGPMGDGQPMLTANVIAFNGVGPEDDYESFALETGQDPSIARHAPDGQTFVWTFCKTARRPYDLAVAAVLLRAKQLAPRHVALSSDGRWNDEWLAARALVEELFGPLDFAADPLREPSVDGPAAVRGIDG